MSNALMFKKKLKFLEFLELSGLVNMSKLKSTTVRIKYI